MKVSDPASPPDAAPVRDALPARLTGLGQGTPDSLPTLAAAFQAAAERWPMAVALRCGNAKWHFAEWLHAAPGLARRDENSPPGIWTTAGDALQLAAGALAASLAGQAFQPLAVGHGGPVPSGNSSYDTALIIHTSGSEGEPRPIRLSTGQLATAARNANQALNLRAGDCWLHCLPAYHIGGQAILWRCAFAGATVLLHEDFSPLRIAQDFADHPVSHISLVPAMLARLIAHDVPPPASLRVALIGGAALAPSLHAQALAAGWPLHPSYGMTESAALIAVFRPDDGTWQAGQVGSLFPDHEAALSPTGRLRLRGPQIIGEPPNHGQLDTDGWLTTGDLASFTADGRLSIHGRADDMLISGGRNVHPLTIEACLAACPGVDDIAVTGLPDPVWGDLIVALVVGPADLASLREWSATRLPGAAQPRRIVRLPALPRNAAGKLARNVLRDLAREGGA